MDDIIEMFIKVEFVTLWLVFMWLLLLLFGFEGSIWEMV